MDSAAIGLASSDSVDFFSVLDPSDSNSDGFGAFFLSCTIVVGESKAAEVEELVKVRVERFDRVEIEVARRGDLNEERDRESPVVEMVAVELRELIEHFLIASLNLIRYLVKWSESESASAKAERRNKSYPKVFEEKKRVRHRFQIQSSIESDFKTFLSAHFALLYTIPARILSKSVVKRIKNREQRDFGLYPLFALDPNLSLPFLRRRLNCCDCNNK